MGCGCRDKPVKNQEAAQQAEEDLEAMTDEEGRLLTPLGLKAGVRLPGSLRINGAGEEMTLVITEEDDKRLFAGATVIRGRDAHIPARLKKKLVASYPGLFVVEEEANAPELVPS